MTNLNRLTCLFWGAAWVAAWTTEAAGQVKDPAPTLKTQLSFLLVGGASQPKDLFYLSAVGGQSIKVSVPVTAVSKTRPTAYDGPLSLSLFLPPPSAGGAAQASTPGKPLPPPLPVAKVSLPRGDQCLILLAPGAAAGAGQPAGYTAIALEDDWKTAPVGTLRFLNYSGKLLKAKFDKGQVADLQKGPSAPIRIVEAGAPELLFRFVLMTDSPAGGEVVYQNELKLAGNQRFTIVLVPAGPRAPNGVLATVVREVSLARLAPGAKPGGGSPTR